MKGPFTSAVSKVELAPHIIVINLTPSLLLDLNVHSPHPWKQKMVTNSLRLLNDPGVDRDTVISKLAWSPMAF